VIIYQIDQRPGLNASAGIFQFAPNMSSVQTCLYIKVCLGSARLLISTCSAKPGSKARNSSIIYNTQPCPNNPGTASLSAFNSAAGLVPTSSTSSEQPRSCSRRCSKHRLDEDGWYRSWNSKVHWLCCHCLGCRTTMFAKHSLGTCLFESSASLFSLFLAFLTLFSPLLDLQNYPLVIYSPFCIPSTYHGLRRKLLHNDLRKQQGQWRWADYRCQEPTGHHSPSSQDRGAPDFSTGRP
jgi:hypothetical protein